MGINMLTKRELYVKIRDGINKTTKKQPLIEEYYRIVMTLTHHADSLYDKPEHAALVKKINTIQEKETARPDRLSPTMTIGFNPYRIRVTKNMIINKITKLHQIMQKYNVK